MKNHEILLIFSGMFLLVSASIGQELVANLERCQDSPAIGFVKSIGTHAIFEANTVEYGEELYITDGTEEGTSILADLTPGSASSSIWEVDVIGDTAYVITYHSDQSEAKVWCVDIHERTFKNILTYDVSGFSSNSSGMFTKVGSVVYFILRNEHYQFELWETKGDQISTNKLSLLPNNSFPKELTAFNDMLYFKLNDVTGDAVWFYNGQYATELFNPDAEEYFDFIRDLTVFGDSLFFIARDSTEGYEIWKSNGQLNGTTPFTDWDIDATYRTGFRELTVFNDELYFIAVENEDNSALWKTSTSAAGIEIVSNTQNDTFPTYLNDLRVLGDYITFNSFSNDSVFNWISDGSSLGTNRIFETTSSNSNITQVDNKFVFSGNDSLHGDELWISDGTSSGTALLMDVEPGPSGSFPSNIVEVNSKAVLLLNTCLYGSELWRTDLTLEGTNIIKDLSGSEAGSYPHRLTVLNDRLIFAARTQELGTELYATDGTEEGTFLLMDINPGYEDSYPQDFCIANDRLFFLAEEDHRNYIFVTNGTSEGTYKVSSVRAQNNLATLNGLIYADLFSSGLGTELWKTDGTEVGTELIKDINPDGGSHPWLFKTIYNGELYFSAHDGVHGQELWKTDGTEEGTKLVKFIDTNNSQPNHHSFHIGGPPTVYEDHLYFTARDPLHGIELWRTDGSSEGTILVKDIRPGQLSSNTRILGVFDDYLFLNSTSDSGSELWRSDGTNAGTTLFKDINQGSSGSYPADFVDIGGQFLFTADKGSSGVEFFISDGTSDGTKLLKDINTGPGNAYPRDVISLNNAFLFGAIDTLNKRSLWITDGTEEGTYKYPGMEESILFNTPHLVLFDEDIYMALSDPDIGPELWKVDGECLKPLDLDIVLDNVTELKLSAKNKLTITGSLTSTDFLQIDAGKTFELFSDINIDQGQLFELQIDDCNE